MPQLHTGLSDCFCGDCLEARKRAMRPAASNPLAGSPPTESELAIYPESRYDEMDRKCLAWLERGYRIGVFESLPVQAQKTEAV